MLNTPCSSFDSIVQEQRRTSRKINPGFRHGSSEALAATTAAASAAKRSCYVQTRREWRWRGKRAREIDGKREKSIQRKRGQEINTAREDRGRGKGRHREGHEMGSTWMPRRLMHHMTCMLR
jgi:hypothetical protein